MPSVPQHKPLQHKPMPGNSWVFVGFFLCAVCLLGLPKYANTDNLGTGIFDGIGLIVLLLAIIGLCSGVARRVGRNRPPKGAEAGSSSDVTRRKHRSNGIGVGLFFLLFGGFLLAFPEAANMGDLSAKMEVAGLLLFLIGLVGISTTVSRHSRENRRVEAAETRTGSGVQGQQRRSNGIGVSLFFLLLGGYLLAFPQGTSMDAFSRGIFYGMGLIVLLIAIMALSSGVARLITKRLSPG